jgi:lysyl-tRNA synthetase class 2
VRAVFGSESVTHADGTTHDLSGPWREVALHEAVSEAVDREVTLDTPVEELRTVAAKFDVELPESASAGEIVLELFEKLVEHTLIEPTFVRDYPVEVRPLVRAHRADPRLAECWDLVVFWTELATGYSELVDPVEQRARLEAQSLRAAAGDPEAMRVDDDFLRAMEYGMPPTGGMGMGIDRLLMTLTGLGIRETILYPLVRPE